MQYSAAGSSSKADYGPGSRIFTAAAELQLPHLPPDLLLGRASKRAAAIEVD